MRAAPAIVLGVLAYGAFLVGTVPASLFTGPIERSTSGRVAFERVDGSLWRGRAALRVRSGAGELAFDEVNWRFLPSRLFVGEAAFALSARRSGLEASAVAAHSFAGTRLRDLRATGTAATFTPLFPLAASWQPEGTVTVESNEFAFGGGDFRGTAKVEWQEAALSLAPARPLGSWKADVTGKDAAIEIALTTAKGPLRLAGKGALKPGSVPGSARPGTLPGFGFAFDGTASADPGREKELEALLALIGPRRPDGLTAISVR